MVGRWMQRTARHMWRRRLAAPAAFLVLALIVGVTSGSATPSNVSGTVTLQGAGPAATVWVNASHPNGGGGWTSVQTLANGTYSIPLDDGNWVLQAQANPGTAYGSSPTLAITVAGAALTGQDLQLPAANVVGHVRGPDASALAGVSVNVLDGSGGYISNGPSGTYSASDGAYALTLPTGSYTLRIQPGAFTGFSYSDTHVTVSSSSSQTVDLIASTPNVTGKVFQHDGATPAQTSVSVYTQSGQYTGTPGSYSATDGSYALNLAPGTWLLRASGANGDSDGTRTVTVAGSGSLANQNITLPVPNLTVNVKDPAPGTTNQQYSWVSVDDASGTEVASASADANGNAVFHVDPGTYTVKVGAPYGSSFARATPVSVTVGGSPATVNVRLRSPNVDGRVVNAAGTPVANASINVTAGSGTNGPQAAWGNSASDGTFSFALDDGPYTIVVTPPGGSASGPSDPVHVSVSGTVHLGNVTLPNANVSGTVTNPDGSPANDASISVHTLDYSQYGYASTASDGSFHLRLAAGDYVADVSPPYGSSLGGDHGSFTLADPVAGVSGLHFTLHTPNVTGVVLTPDHDAHGVAVTPSAVPLTSVSVRNSDYSFQANGYTDGSGAFHLYLPVDQGPYLLKAYAPSGSDYDTSPEVTIAGPTSATVTLRLVARNVTGFVYQGSIAGDGSTVAANVGVDIHNADYSFYTWARTDAQGKFRAGLVAGTYTATARSASSAFTDSDPVQFTVAADGSFTPATLNLVLGTPQLTGTVVDDTGTPMPYASVSVHDAGYSHYRYGQTQSDGSFSFGGLPAGGGYTVELYPPFGHSQLVHTQVTGLTIPTSASQLPVRVENNADHNLHFAVATGIIHVTIHGSSGSITSGASVSGYSDSGGYAYASSPTSGTYDLHVENGTWNVSVYPLSSSTSWLFNARPSRVVVDSSHSTVSVTLNVADASSHITGTVTDPNGNPEHANAAWIWVSTSNGLGNGGPVGAGGTFNIAVTPGSYQVYVYPQDSTLGAPPALPVTVAAGATTSVGSLQLLRRDSTISGTVAYASGAPIEGADVFAYQPNGGGYADATTQADGTYTLRVSGGTWEVGIWPQPGDPWIFQDPPQEIVVAAASSSSGHNFTPQPVAGHIAGRVLDPSGNPALIDGWADATGGSGETGAPLDNGSFSIPATPGTYVVQLFLSPGTPYISTHTATVTVGADGTVNPVSVTLDLGALDDTISGHVVDQSGAQLAAQQVSVSASDDNGNYEYADVAADGSYSLLVGPGAWHVGVEVSNPGLSAIGLGNGSGGVGSSTVTFAGHGATQTRDVIVAPADQDVVGVVKTSGGGAVPYAWISVDSPPSATTQVHTGGTADEAGHFDVKVPAGTYLVGASATVPNEDQPQVVTLTTASGTQSVSPLQLSFRTHTATLAGHVSSPVGGLQITVNAWSDKGALAHTAADTGGNYTLSVAGSDTWHLSAGAVAGAQAYVTSAGSAVVAGASGAYTADDMTLAAQAVPTAQTVTFDATSPQVLHFGDVDLVVPAGTLDTSGQVRITASALAAPADTASAHPIGIGYTFQAFDSSGTEVKTRFPNQIRVTFPYDPDRLAALGLTADQLAPAYFDPATNTYRAVQNVVVDATAHTVSFSTDHFTSFVLASAVQSAPTVGSVSPDSADIGSVQTLSIGGTGFVSGASVLVGSYAATGVTVLSSTSIRATLPANVPGGTYSLTVANSSGRSGTKASALTLHGPAASPGAGSVAAAKARLSLAISSFPSAVRVGDLLTYTIAVSSDTAARATGITLHVDLPVGVTLLSTYADHGPGTCTGTVSLQCFLDFLDANGTATVRITVRVDKPGTLLSGGSLTFDQLGSTKGATVSSTVDVGARQAPVVNLGGGATALHLGGRGTTGVVTAGVKVDQAVTLRMRIVTGKARKPLLLLKGSSAGSVTLDRQATAVTIRTTGARSVALRAVFLRRTLKGPAYLEVTETGLGGASTKLIPLRR